MKKGGFFIGDICKKKKKGNRLPPKKKQFPKK